MARRLKFSDEHLWVRVEGDQAHVGLTDYLQRRLGEVTSVRLPDVGEEVERGEPLGELQAARETRELIAPVSGIVVATNADLEDQPTLVNEDPYEDGWLVEVEVRDEEELEDLIDADEYDELVAEESEEEEDED
jgi:glycine cleavage system H protein